ncbi:MAG: transcription termination/antitermination factor NusG [Ignavibacteriae bacterium]|nr:transcription termination/antitermination factor NusG [Ignavibacteriota bacterium]MCB9216270.1 transcription termination/antitermination factor NusG [Ignavibacteria bacterium]
MSTHENTIEKKWYALRIFSGHESRVLQLLENELERIGLSEYVPHIIIPQEKVFEVRDGKKRTRMKNFLPGYLLIEAILTKKVIDVIQNTPSVMSFLGRKNEPEALQDHEVRRILDRMEERKNVETIVEAFEVGDPVKVIDGPFNNFSGIVREVNNQKQKLKVEVSIFGRKTPVLLDYTQVEMER